MAVVALPPIEQPKQRELTFNPVTDVENLIKSFIAGERVHRDDDVREISAAISQIFDVYKAEAKNDADYQYACKLTHFIRVLRYGVLFDFFVMVKLPDESVFEIYYEPE